MQIVDLQIIYRVIITIPSLIANLNNLTKVLFWLTGVASLAKQSASLHFSHTDKKLPHF